MGEIKVIRSTINRLENWGSWARADNLRLGAVGTLGRLSGASVSSLKANDIDAQQIDSLVAKLIRRDREMGIALKFYYFKRFKYRDIAVKLKIGKDKAQRLVMSGVAWVDGALEFDNANFK